MSKDYNCPCTDSCFLQSAMDTIGGKWKLPVLCSITANGSSRYNDILRSVKGISNTMLSKTLKELEESGMVSRSEFLEVPVRVEYDITDKSRELQPILMDIIKWEMEWQKKASNRK